MNGEFNSNQSEMLHAYLDGEASSTEEHVLFSALAENEDLRSEMRDLLAIRNAIHGDKEAFAPPLAATAAIFAGLGFSASAPASAMSTVSAQTVPSSFNSAVSQTGSQSGTQSLFGTSSQMWLKPLIGALISSALTASIVTSLLLPPAAKNVPAAAPEPVPVQLIIQAPETPMLGDVWVDSENKQAGVKQIMEAEAKPVAFIENREQQSIPANDFFVPAIEQPAIIRNPQLSDLQTPPQQINSNLTSYFSGVGDGKEHFILQLSNSPMAQSYFENGNSMGRRNPLESIQTGLFYIVGDHHAFGIEAGYEPFQLQWTEKTEFADTTLGSTQYGTWINAVYRFQTGDLASIPGLKAFGQIGAGGVIAGKPEIRGGFLGRSIVGLQYEIGYGVLIHLGLEGSTHIYQISGYTDYKSTNNLGFHNGISVQF